MNGLEGKIAVVTGGAAGLGRATAERLGAEGARVLITDVNEGAGRAVARELGLTFHPHDVRSEEAWREVMGFVRATWGRLDILVNNAGVLGAPGRSDPETSELEDWRRVFSVNVDGVFLGCRAALPLMKEGGSGAIVNVGSVAGLLATPYATAYGASKAAVAQLTRSFAQHCADLGLRIRCNAVHPGDVWTPLQEASAAHVAVEQRCSIEEVIASRRRMTPLGDFTRPADVAAAIAFLASDDAAFVTGHGLAVDGGVLGCDTFHTVQAGRPSVEARSQ